MPFFSTNPRVWNLILALLVYGSLSAAQAQGTVIFSTYVPGIVDARVFCGDGRLAGPEVSAQLWAGASFDQLRPLLPATVFGTGALAGYVAPPSEPVVVPGFPEGGTVGVVVLRVWDNFDGTTSWEDAGFFGRGESNPIQVGPLGGETLAPAYLIGLQDFQPLNLLCIPEPRFLPLIALGVGAVVLLRRHRSDSRAG